ncbi:phosphoribosylanthranilate isomerase [Lactiplantibacillus pentosus]|uniref:phosphoribosylanthranilate isomerase n=1 Tax=Lactiplantibacillus pentosus TaxID=1589 RepID=UPI000EAAA852|nr:phosphoribosylanthranilate isomerase [Lactiplantibacillus pentosus]AYG37287.1 phosphoribosylanthranilate isomerase [Lactiplantibacillus pentosus]AYG39944.1 phosphoribosylanthranilate isomerase [Lactiplantibacillus pentosus]MCJ8182481.1 phosphoribosylanthranilate isomerase [Lactiplantibacillus pentosus]
MTQIKICGLMRLADVAMVNQARPDAIGFIFAPERRRQITLDLARQMAAQLNPQIQRVGVFTTNSLAEILALVQAHIIQVVQLHGALDDPRVPQLRAAHIPVIQAVIPADAIRCQADYPLLDNLHPGSGQVLDWTDLPRLKRPFILAGGLTPENVTTAIQQVHPAMVDVSSGVETNGQKNVQKIAAIVARAHQLN